MNKLIEYKWKIFIWINILWVLAAISIGFTTYTSVAPTNSTNTIETIKIVFIILGGLGIILPVYINATNSMEDRDFKKIENTFSLIQKWDDPHLFAARKFTRELKTKKKSLSDDELIKLINNNDDLKQSIILVMNYFEQIRISIIAGRIDVELFKASLGPVAIDICKRLHPYIESLSTEYINDWDELTEHLKKN